MSLLRNSWRSWKNAKAVGVIAVAALGIGVGSATAIYSVADAVLLRPVPYLHGERYVSLVSTQKGESEWSGTSWLNLLEYQRRTQSFDLFGIYRQREFSMTAPGEPRMLTAVEGTPTLLRGLGVNPVLGRWFGEAPRERGNVYLAVISTSLWKILGGTDRVLGQSLTLDSRNYVVTGVMPEWFRFPVYGALGQEVRADIWVPLNPQGSDRDRSTGSYMADGRMKPGVTVAQADADAKRVAAQLVQEGYVNPRYSAFVEQIGNGETHAAAPPLLLLMGAAVALLLITCANVAGLLLARSVARSRETAIRVAMGATRRQLAAQYLAEGSFIAVGGAIAGVLVAIVFTRYVVSVGSDYIPRADEISVNGRSLLFAAGVAILSSVLFSLGPLWQAMNTMPNEVLSDGARSSAGSRTRGLSRTLVVAEIALAFTLLSTGAILFTHLSGLLRTHPGFNPDGLATFSMNVSTAEYPQMGQRDRYLRRVLETLRRIPGVSAASFANQIPLAGCCAYKGLFPLWRPPERGRDQISYMVVGPDYLRTMQIPLRKGRFIEDADAAAEESIGVAINEAAARQFWPGREAIGSYARFSSPDGPEVHVVGVVGDVRNNSLSRETRPEIYFPGSAFAVNPVRFQVRSVMPLATLMPAVRHAVQSVDPSQALKDASTLRDIVLGSVTVQRLESFFTGFFSLSALLMAALGIYGVVSYSVRHRTVEIGTRMAIGAASRDVMRMVIGDGFRMAGWGALCGGLTVAAAAWLLRSQIFGIGIADSRPFLASTGIVASFTGAACFFPAWRATLLSPMVAIRDDASSIWETAHSGARTLARQISQIVSGPEDDVDLTEGILLGEFVEASRRAESFREAIQLSVAKVCEVMNARSAILLERDGEFFGRDGLVLETTGLLAGRLHYYPFPLPIGRGDLDAWERGTDPVNGAEIDGLRESGAALAVPLLAHRDIEGILLLGPHVGRGFYTQAEKRVLRNCAGQFALMIGNARLTDRIVEQEKLRSDVELAIEVQRRLFPDKPPRTSAFSLAGMSVPARSVGGDYYDFLDLGDHKIGVALADVAGKGVAAALIMSVVQASLRILAAEDGVSLSALAGKMNRYLHRSTQSRGYATFFYAQIDERKRQLRYVNAGHNPPCLLRYVASQQIEELPAGGTVIGMFPNMNYREASIDLEPGDVLMAFTDGVTEALNPANEQYGEKRLKELLRRIAHLNVDQMASAVLAELKAWIADAAQYDDLTFIFLKMNA